MIPPPVRGRKVCVHCICSIISSFFFLRAIKTKLCGILKLLYVISGDSRQKEKKMAKTRSKVKSSDEDGSPKSAQKKVKLLQPYVVYLFCILCWPSDYISFLKLIFSWFVL